MSGLPRAGSTLLLNILGQNPRLHVTGTSGLIELVQTIKAKAWNIAAIKAMGDNKVDQKIIQITRGLIKGFYLEVPDNKIIIDKCRGWENQLELLRAVLETEPKIICPVRDIREILSSFEKLYRKTISTRAFPDDKATPFKMKTIRGRCTAHLQNDGGVIATPANAIKDAVQRGWRKNLLFVDFERLTNDPGPVMGEIYGFLGETFYTHNFNEVKQITHENDLIHIYKGLHDIRPKVEPVKPDWMQILPKAITDQVLEDAKFWQKL